MYVKYYIKKYQSILINIEDTDSNFKIQVIKFYAA